MSIPKTKVPKSKSILKPAKAYGAAQVDVVAPLTEHKGALIKIKARKQVPQVQSPYVRCSLYGVALVASEIFDPDFGIHGPQGCISTVKEAFALQKKEIEYHTSSMNKDDIVFSGEKKLFETVADVFTPYEKAGPKFIITTCASEIIGDNVNGVAAKFNCELPTIVIPGGGVNGDHYYGINKTLLEMAKRYAIKGATKRKGFVNLIGNIGLSRNWKADYHELERLLVCLGLDVNPLGCDSTSVHFELASEAEYTIIVTSDIGLPLGQYLEKNHDVPLITSSFGIPIGLRGTEIWLREISAQIVFNESTLEILIDKQEEFVRTRLKVGLHQMTYIEKLVELKNMPVAVIAEGPVAVGWARFLSEEIGLRVIYLGLRTKGDDNDLLTLLSRVKNELEMDVDVEIVASEEEVRSALERHRPHAIYGSSVEARIGQELGIVEFIHISNPNTQYVTLTEVPFLGYHGVINITEKILNNHV